MDLVDIDQVLDNLELREAADENNKSTASIATSQCKAHFDSSAGSQSPTKSCGNGSGSGSSSSNTNGGAHKSGFVGVSQVFNSLDDYRKNVESLETATLQRYDEECRLIANTSEAAEHALLNCEVKTLPTKLNKVLHRAPTPPPTPLTPSALPAVNSIGTALAHNSYAHDGEDEDEEEASDDLHKFTEATNDAHRHGYEADDADEHSPVTSDSLTTSSSSTFSSGPSPGLVSTTDEHSAPLSPDEECVTEERDALLPEMQVSLSQQQTEEGSTHEQGNVRGVESTAGLDDLAVGLSSISLTTANSQSNLPCEATVSSVLKNVLEDLTETTSTHSLLSQKRDADDAKQLAQPTIEEDVMCAVPNAAFTATTAHVDNKAVLNKVQLQEQLKPITFGSTMDEISDTELDSMLQEMDIDDVTDIDGSNRAIVSSARSPSPVVSAESFAPAENNANNAADSVEHIDDPHPDLDTTQDVENHIGAVDCMNADSFSQASTVEFSEIRAHSTDHVQVDDMAQSSNSAASSYTSTESSLEGDVIATDGNVAEAECAIVEEGSADEGPYSEELAQQRPQRPTTLNLPILQSNMYENAGQTPPGASVTPEHPSCDGVSNENGIAEENATSAGELSNNINGDVAEATGYSDPYANLGKVPPIWVPDNMAAGCMQCHAKFTMIKRRHHCRACGKVLCSVCCSQKFKLEFLSNPAESRVCLQCFLILTQRQEGVGGGVVGRDIIAGDDDNVTTTAAAASITTTTTATSNRSPNPNNPMEYCSTIPPHRQVTTLNAQPPSVIVPVGVLKKDGSYSSNSSNGSGKKGRKRKSVMFSDGIAPGSDLASMEHQWADAKHARRGHQQGDKTRTGAGANKPPTPVRTQPSSDATTIGLVASLFRGSIPPIAAASTIAASQSSNDYRVTASVTANSKSKTNTTSNNKADTVTPRAKRLPPSGCDENGCFIPRGDDNSLPPLYVRKDDSNCDFDYKDVRNNVDLTERLQRETLRFALEKNFFVDVKIVNLKCCMNRTVINFTTYGMHHVGNDELIILLEYEPPTRDNVKDAAPPMPKDIFIHLYEIYRDAELGNPIAELAYTSPRQSNFLGSREYGGFIFIRATFQCLQDLIVPDNPFLIGILIHRYEVPWAKVFPLRLMLRLGAQYRYYPCPHISIRNRDSVYAEIAQTIINFLADFRNYSYTLPCIKGMYIHMEDRQTTVMIPRNRQEDVIKAIKNSSDHILAFGGNFSKTADGHLVCMQNVNDTGTEMYAYSTQAINIQGQPRKVTGASFFVLNESLKSTSGLSGKCSIVEDGLMVQILPAKMEAVRNALQNQKDIEIVCGPVDADDQQTEVVSIKWVDNDRDFNNGVKSPIDSKSMEGIASMRVHDSFNYSNANYAIRLTDIYILKFDEWYDSAQTRMVTTSMDITRMAEQVARSASVALVPFLDLLVASGSRKLSLRATLHQENVCYEAGTRGNKLPPLYMNALDNHLIPTLHGESSGIEDAIILELIFYILNV